jgi:hypothetical protein
VQTDGSGLRLKCAAGRNSFFSRLNGDEAKIRIRAFPALVFFPDRNYVIPDICYDGRRYAAQPFSVRFPKYVKGRQQ